MKPTYFHTFTWFAVCIIFFAGSICGQDLCQPVGWATLNGGVTGGGSATPITVSTYNELKTALTSSSQKVVYVSGTIIFPSAGRITIQDQSGKSIIGLPGSKLISEDQTKSGSGIFYMKRCTNFIMRNLVFEGPGAYDVDGYDNLCIDNCQNFWVDHCEFHDGVDGNFDIKNMSDYISVTWCTFSYEKPPRAGGSGGSNDHRYSNLIGSSDGASGDEGKLNVTFYFCWWGEGCRERMPRLRFGKLHMVNTLFSSSVSNHCIRAGYKANIYAEGNYFDNQRLPIDEFDNNYTGIKAVNNVGQANMTKGTPFTPSYTIPVLAAEDIVTPIKTCAGAKLPDPTGCSSCGGPVNRSPTVNITAPSENASFDAPAMITISANAHDPDGSVSRVDFFEGTTLLGSDNSAPFSFAWSNISAGTYTLTARATDNNGATAVSSPVTIIVIDPNLPSLLSTANTTQSVTQGAAIEPIVFTWSGAATDVTHTTLPDGLAASRDGTEKTLTISGSPVEGGSFSVSTVGGSPGVTIQVSVSIQIPGQVLANWYPFQENPVTLPFVTLTDASVETDYYDQTKPANGVAYTPGAARLNKGTGSMTLTLRSLDVLKVRWYATGGRTLRITYGPQGTENIWNSPIQYESGASEFDLTTMIPSLVSSAPIKVIIINNRTDGGSLNIHDLYVEGTTDNPTQTSFRIAKTNHNSGFGFVNTGKTIQCDPEYLSLMQSKQPVSIVNVLGKTIMTGTLSPTIDISTLQHGIYFLKTGVYTWKFMKR